MTVNLDHYVGRHVTSVEFTGSDAPEREEAGVWQVVLEGDVCIVNFDSEYPVPDDALIGMTLSKVAMSPAETRLDFGVYDDDGNLLSSAVMFLSPMEYGISDPNREDVQGVVRPQAAQFDPETPPHPDERVAEAPEEPAQATAEDEEVPEHPDDE